VSGYDLKYFFWEATRRCNLRCLHCGSECVETKQSSEASAPSIVTVFRDIASSFDPARVMVAVTGGEPLLRTDLFEILEEIQRLGFPWGMVSNGMLMDKKMLNRCVKSGMKTVSISLDGPERIHNWLRGNPRSFRQAVDALERLVGRRELQSVECITCVHTFNIETLEQVRHILVDVGVDAWRLLTVFPKGRALLNPALVVNRDLLLRLFEYIAARRADSPSMLISYSEEGFIGPGWESAVRDHKFECSAGRTVGGLLADGSFSACPSLSRSWIQGHLNEVSFPVAWKTRYAPMRSREDLRCGVCMDCSVWEGCNGGSLHLRDSVHSKLSVCHYRLLHGHPMD
jgi:radical SAM protein with 4Fe4S-binding SPASM domain